MNRLNRMLLLWAIFAVFCLSMSFVGMEDYKQSITNHSNYCDMVQLYKNTGGQLGWPPYKGECDD